MPSIRAHGSDRANPSPEPNATQRQPQRDRVTCLGSTCLKWSENGELSDQDRAALLQQLAVTDTNLANTMQANA
jgi:hypothetical protein